MIGFNKVKMIKLIQIPGIWNDGSPSIELLNPSVFEKTASALPEEILEVIRHIKPRYDGIYVHTIGLGAGEYYSLYSISHEILDA